MMLLSVNHLSFSYSHHRPVLKDISFTLEEGEALAVIGASGSGKSTLLKLIAGLIAPASGSAIKNLAKRPAYVSQEDSLLEWLTVTENIFLPYKLENIPVTAEIREKALQMLTAVGLEDFADCYPSQLSGGMKKRAELARALTYNPDLILLDEPFSALDIITREHLTVLYADLSKKSGSTLILITHSIDEACYLADKIILLAGKPAIIAKEVQNDRTANASKHFLLSKETAANSKFLRSVLESGNQMQTLTEEIPELPARTPHRFFKRAAETFSLLTLFMGALLLVKSLFKIPDYLLPSPLAVLQLFIKTLASATIFTDVAYTVTESLSGFIIALLLALPAGYVINRFAFLRRFLLPSLIAANAVPIVALAPFLVLWFGLGLAPKIIAAMLIVFFPLLISTIQAFKLAFKQVRMHLFFFKPSLIKGVFNLELPAALPVIFSGIKVSVTTSVIGAVVGEFVSGSKGLGSLLTIAKANFDLPLMFVALIWLIILSLIYYFTVSYIEKKLLHRL
jgi:ABC-type nitrate/sulfonate/bicarbonate transport system ATPase subunit/ABC-type nitrate/sulfonate/bicarbonate transport system permease component